MRKIILGALGLAGLGLIFLGAVVLGQDSTGVVTDPTLANLTTATGLAAFITVVLNLGRGFTDAATFDRFAPLAATIVGVVVSVLLALVTGGPDTPETLLTAAFVGFFAGQLSQNVNTTFQRAAGNVDTP